MIGFALHRYQFNSVVLEVCFERLYDKDRIHITMNVYK